MLIPEERWKRSPARIAKSSGVVEKFADELGINPAILFGRIQKERENYAVFSNLIGRGQVRKYLIEATQKRNSQMNSNSLPIYVPALRLKQGEYRGLQRLA